MMTVSRIRRKSKVMAEVRKLLRRKATGGGRQRNHVSRMHAGPVDATLANQNFNQYEISGKEYDFLYES